VFKEVKFDGLFANTKSFLFAFRVKAVYFVSSISEPH